MARTLTADRGDGGRRLDLVLRRRLTDLAGASRTRVQGWIESGSVAVNGRRVTRAAARVAAGDVVTVDLPDRHRRGTPQPEDVPLDVLYEDDYLIAVNKPAGLVVHPTYKHPHGTLLNGLLWRSRDRSGDAHPALAGRLDRFTSGVVIAAMSTQGYAALHRALRIGEKDYLAVVHRRVDVTRGTIDLPLGRDPRDRRRVIVLAAAPAHSVTEFETLAVSATVEASLLRCRLVTGRMHQIRVHLGARGWPIVGDAVYGNAARVGAAAGRGATAADACPRQALHSWRVVFTHPATGEPLVIEAPVPADFAALCEALDLPTRLPV